MFVYGRAFLDIPNLTRTDVPTIKRISDRAGYEIYRRAEEFPRDREIKNE